MKILKTINPYPISKMPKAWRSAIRFDGCGRAKDAVIVYASDGHSGKGYYVYCNEYPEEGATFLGKRMVRP